MGQIAVLGSSGMLGFTLTQYLSSQFGPILEVNRSGVATVVGNKVEALSVTNSEIVLESIFSHHKIEYAINAIGKIRQLIETGNDRSTVDTWNLNTRFPRVLNDYCLENDIKLIQIGTDCVFSGREGKYSESQEFDPIDLYGETKAIGERVSLDSMILRCSIVGIERNSKNSLMEWVLGHPRNADIDGFENHIWNGVTTLDFARLISGVISNELFQRGTHHVVPAGSISKFDLVKFIAEEFDRHDLRIQKTQAKLSVDRSLSTLFPDRNESFWIAAGYTQVPTIHAMLDSYAKWLKSV